MTAPTNPLTPLTRINARRQALRAVRMAYRKVLAKRTPERVDIFYALRKEAHDLHGVTVRETNAVIRDEWARREQEIELQTERKLGLAVDICRV